MVFVLEAMLCTVPMCVIEVTFTRVCYGGDAVYLCVVEAWCVPVCVVEGDGLAIGDEHHVPVRQVLHTAHRCVKGQRLHRLRCVPVPKSTHTHTHGTSTEITLLGFIENILPFTTVCIMKKKV